MRTIGVLLFLTFLLPGHDASSQDTKQARLDSLKRSFSAETADSSRTNTAIEIGRLIFQSGDSAERYALLGLEGAQRLHMLRQEGTAWNLLGIIYYYKSDFLRSISCYTRALEIDQQRNNKKDIPDRLRNIAICYRGMGDYGKSIGYLFRSLKAAEELQDKDKIAVVLTHLGNVYYKQGDYDNALRYYQRCLQTTTDEKETGNTLNNMGSIKNQLKDYTAALDYYARSLEIRKKIGDSTGMVSSYTNISLAQSNRGEYKLALENALQAYAIASAMGYEITLYNACIQIATVYQGMKDLRHAEQYALQALAYAQKARQAESLTEVYLTMSDIYRDLHDDASALAFYKKHIAQKDSLLNEESTRRSIQAQMQYEFSKKQAGDSIHNAEQIRQEGMRHEQEIRQQRIYTYGGALGFLFMVIVAAVSFRAFRQKQSANLIISQQKELVEEKQKEILDSIQYARKIQLALLPPERYIHRHLDRLKRR